MEQPAAGPLLEGRKVVLRPFTFQDITPAYLSWLNDPVVVRLSNQRFRRHDMESSARYLQSFAGTANLFLSARLRETGQAVGTLTAYIAPQHGTADVGIMIGDRAAWGQGVGQDAWKTLCDWLLSGGGLRKLTAGTLDCNAAMIRIMERSGMRLEAVRHAQELVEGTPHDILHYARFAGR